VGVFRWLRRQPGASQRQLTLAPHRVALKIWCRTSQELAYPTPMRPWLQRRLHGRPSRHRLTSRRQGPHRRRHCCLLWHRLTRLFLLTPRRRRCRPDRAAATDTPPSVSFNHRPRLSRHPGATMPPKARTTIPIDVLYVCRLMHSPPGISRVALRGLTFSSQAGRCRSHTTSEPHNAETAVQFLELLTPEGRTYR